MINTTFIIVIIGILLFGFLGYRRGLVGIVFAVLSWIAVFFIVGYGAPVVEGMLKMHSNLYDNIVVWLNKQVEARTEGLLSAELGFVENAVTRLADLMIVGISRLITLVVAVFVSLIIRSIIKLIDKIPVLGKTSRIVGMVIGVMSAVLMTWIAFYLADCFAATKIGAAVLTDAKNNPFLQVLYDHNLLVETLGKNLFKIS